MLQCSCLCEQIEFEVQEIPGLVFNCHGSRCRKSHGAAFATQVIADKESLRFKRGRECLAEFKAPEAIRSFCSLCGSRLFNSDNGIGTYLSVALSAVVSSIPLRPVGECFVKEKLSFVKLDESLPQFEQLPVL